MDGLDTIAAFIWAGIGLYTAVKVLRSARMASSSA